MNITNVNEGIKIRAIDTSKFKTFTVSFYITRKLCKEEVTLNALLPFVIKKGSEKFKDSKAVSQELESLYGGFYDCGIRKKGENQIISINYEFISPKYIKENDYTDKIFDFIIETMFNPFIINDGFSEEFVNREKENLKDFIEGLINNKKEYASVKCVEEMCKGEPYALFEYGNIEDLEKINEKNLYEHYKKVLSESVIDVFITGEVDYTRICDKLKTLNRPMSSYSYNKTSIQKFTDKNQCVETFKVNQGKLSMGFVTNVSFDDDDSYALTVFNSIFGSGAHSKLFNNVREKLSLCYYVNSRLDKYKGIMLVNSGVEFENFDKAIDEILKQLKEVQEGNITNEEITASKKSIVNLLNSLKDNAFSLEDYYLNAAINDRFVSIEDFISNIEKVTIDDIMKVANKIELSTTYKLIGEEE